MKLINLISYFRYFIYLLPAMMAAAGILAVFSCRKNLRQQAGKGLHDLKYRVLPIVLLTLVYAGAVMGANLLRSCAEARTVIGFNYKEASQGLNPNGTRFNSYDIISDEVLEEVLTRLDSDLSVRQLRGTLSVYPVAAGSKVSAEHFYVSTQYVLSCRMSFKTIRLDARKTVDTVAEVFYEQFLENYSRNTDVLSVDLVQVDEMDYLDKPDLMEEMANKIQEYMQGCQQTDPSFRSSSNESFGEVGTRAGKFKNVTLERLNSYILANGISEDAEQYISRLNYDNTVKDVSYRKNLAAHKLRLEAIDFYERDLASIVLVPTRDEDGEFYMGRTKIGVDDFAVEAEKFMQNATDLQKKIETNNYKIGQLRQGGGGGRTEVDRLLEEAKQELRGVEASARQILEEYDAANASDILVVTPQGRSLKSRLRVNLCAMCTAGFLVVLIALFVVFPRKAREYRYVEPDRSRL